MCENENVVFEVGSGQKAILNETDYTKMIEAYYKKETHFVKIAYSSNSPKP